MATVREIYQYLDGLAPFSLQMEFDNAGFLVGRGERAVSKILVSLDITEEVAEEAAELGAELVPDPVREKRLRQYLTAQGIDCRLAAYYDQAGHLRLELEGAGLAPLRTEEGTAKLSKLVNFPLRAVVEGRRDRLVLLQSEPLMAVAGVAAK